MWMLHLRECTLWWSLEWNIIKLWKFVSSLILPPHALGETHPILHQWLFSSLLSLSLTLTLVSSISLALPEARTTTRPFHR